MTEPMRERLRFSHIALEEEAIVSLTDFNLTVYEGEICILTGRRPTEEHSIMRIMRGDTVIDAGEIHINEKRVDTVDQSLLVNERIFLAEGEKGLAQGLSVAENLFLLRPRSKGSPFLRTRALYLEACEVLESLNLHFDANDTVDQFSAFDQVLICLARGVANQAHVFILDLTSDSFKPEEYQRLQTLLAKLQSQGAAFLIIDDTPNVLLDLADKIVITHEGRDCKTLFRSPQNTNMRSNLYGIFEKLGMSLALESHKSEIENPKSTANRLPANNALTAIKRDKTMLFSLNPGEILCFSELTYPEEVDTRHYIQRFLDKNGASLQIEGKTLNLNHSKTITFVPDVSRDLFHKNLPLSDLILLPRYKTIANRLGLVNPALNEIARREFCLEHCENENAMTIDDLSRVERRLLSIYRFAMAKPRVIVLDDPTQNLDALDRTKILDYLRTIADTGIFILLTQYRSFGERSLCAKTIHTADGSWLEKRSVE